MIDFEEYFNKVKALFPEDNQKYLSIDFHIDRHGDKRVSGSAAGGGLSAKGKTWEEAMENYYKAESSYRKRVKKCT